MFHSIIQSKYFLFELFQDVAGLKPITYLAITETILFCTMVLQSPGSFLLEDLATAAVKVFLFAQTGQSDAVD